MAARLREHATYEDRAEPFGAIEVDVTLVWGPPPT
jgi:hypothetical protein